jgi:hypothetical protein
MKWWFSFLLKVIIARGRKLRKSGGGEVEVDKQNVVASDQGVDEQNVVTLDEVVVEQNVIRSY